MMLCDCTRFISTIFQILGFYKYVPATKVYFENHDSLKSVLVQILSRLSQKVMLIRQSDEEDCDVSVVSCSIVSRAGTDIAAALSRTRADKPTLVLVLHHTFDAEFIAPDSTKYGNDNLMLVEILFYENVGLLDCAKNNEALIKAENYLQNYSKPQRKVNIMRVLIACATAMFVFYKTR